MSNSANHAPLTTGVPIMMNKSTSIPTKNVPFFSISVKNYLEQHFPNDLFVQGNVVSDDLLPIKPA